MGTVPDPFSVTAAEVPGGQLVLSVRGEVDMATAPMLDRLISSLDDGASQVVVDMSRVSFIDSTGAMALLEIRRQLSQAGRKLLIANPSPFVDRVLRLTGAGALVPGARRAATDPARSGSAIP